MVVGLIAAWLLPAASLRPAASLLPAASLRPSSVAQRAWQPQTQCRSHTPVMREPEPLLSRIARLPRRVLHSITEGDRINRNAPPPPGERRVGVAFVMGYLWPERGVRTARHHMSAAPVVARVLSRPWCLSADVMRAEATATWPAVGRRPPPHAGCGACRRTPCGVCARARPHVRQRVVGGVCVCACVCVCVCARARSRTHSSECVRVLHASRAPAPVQAVDTGRST